MTPDQIERERPYLFGIAYRILGSAADADDVLQEAFLRARSIDDADARSPRALLAATDRSEAACRQLLHRAKEHVAARRRRFPAAPDAQKALTARFLGALAAGD